MIRDLFVARTTLGWIVRMLSLFVINYAILMVLAGLPMTPLLLFILNYLPFVPMAVLVIGLFLWARSVLSIPWADMDASAGKPKRGESVGELMSILNDEEIDELRGRVKARLEEQIDHADADEVETFADLLDETKQKRGQ